MRDDFRIGAQLGPAVQVLLWHSEGEAMSFPQDPKRTLPVDAAPGPYPPWTFLARTVGSWAGAAEPACQAEKEARIWKELAAEADTGVGNFAELRPASSRR